VRGTSERRYHQTVSRSQTLVGQKNPVLAQTLKGLRWDELFQGEVKVKSQRRHLRTEFNEEKILTGDKGRSGYKIFLGNGF
jgi:hypothetical protein